MSRAPIRLADFSSRAALDSPAGAITDLPGGGVRLTTSGATNYLLSSGVLAQPVDVSAGTLVIPFRPIANCGTMQRFSLQLFSSGSPASVPPDYHQVDPNGPGQSAAKQILTATSGEGRTQALGVPSTGLVVAGAGANLAAIRWVRFLLRGSTNAMTIDMGMDGEMIRFQPNSLTRAKCVISLDDGYADIFAVARPLFRAKGWNCSFNLGALQTQIDQPDRLSLAQCRQMVAEGDHLMFQAWSTENRDVIDAMSDAERSAELQHQEDFLRDHALMQTGDSRFGSFFSGVSQSDTIAWPMFRDFLTDGTRAHFEPRGVNPPLLYGETFPWPDKHIVRAIAADGAGAGGFREAHIQQAVANRGVAILNYHRDMSSLTGLLDYLDAERANVDVVSFKQLIRR